MTRDNSRHKVPLAAIALMYQLEPSACVVFGSEAHTAMTEGERQLLTRIPAPCAGLYYRWLGVQADFKAGVDSDDTRRLKALLQNKTQE